MSRNLYIIKETSLKAIINYIRVRFREEVSYKVAQLCRLRLLNRGLREQRYSFRLLPAYQRRLEEAAPDIYIDLVIDLITYKTLIIYYTNY